MNDNPPRLFNQGVFGHQKLLQLRNIAVHRLRLAQRKCTLPRLSRRFDQREVDGCRAHSLGNLGHLLTQSLNFPTFEAGGMTLLKRSTFIVVNGKIHHIFYPVFPPDQSASDVKQWLQSPK